MFRLRPDVARYTNTLARKNTDGKLKKKQKNLKKNSTETNSNSKPEEKGNSREEKINEVESQVRMGSVWLKSLGKIWSTFRFTTNWQLAMPKSKWTTTYCAVEC